MSLLNDGSAIRPVAIRPRHFYNHPMGWRAWDAYDTEAQERWRALPWDERYSWRGVAVLALIAILLTLFAASSATAQVVIPQGDFDNNFEKYLVVAVSLAALVFAVWRYYKNQR